MFNWFKKQESIPVEICIQKQTPKLYSHRVRELKYGSGITDFLLEKYDYHPLPEGKAAYVCYSYANYPPYWQLVKKFITESSAKKAYNEVIQEQYNKSIISDKVIWP